MILIFSFPFFPKRYSCTHMRMFTRAHSHALRHYVLHAFCNKMWNKNHFDNSNKEMAINLQLKQPILLEGPINYMFKTRILFFSALCRSSNIEKRGKKRRKLGTERNKQENCRSDVFRKQNWAMCCRERLRSTTEPCIDSTCVVRSNTIMGPLSLSSFQLFCFS